MLQTFKALKENFKKGFEFVKSSASTTLTAVKTDIVNKNAERKAVNAFLKEYRASQNTEKSE